MYPRAQRLVTGTERWFQWINAHGVGLHRHGKPLYDSTIAGGSLFRPDGTLRYAADGFLAHVPERYQPTVSALLGAMIAAAHNGAMVLLDSEAVQIVARYAMKIAPELCAYLLPVQPQLVDLGALLPGLTAGCGLQILRASLFMLNHMKTFEEARVSVASDGPGAKRQHR